MEYVEAQQDHPQFLTFLIHPVIWSKSQKMRSHLLLLPLFLPFGLISIINLSTSQCLDHQQSLLLQFKHNLIFNPTISKKLVHWNNQTANCCDYDGVKCNNNGHVIGLDLSEEFISKGLDNNSSLFSLLHLQSLNLAYNNFGSLIPSNFDKLKSLRHLNLSNSGFVGQVPLEITQLTELETLDLSTSLSLQHTLKLERPNIAMFVQNFTELTELYLDGVKISSEGKEWCQALSSLRKLKVLSMSSCDLSGPIDPSLALLKTVLSTIHLNMNNISGPVPEFFSSFSDLKVMELRSCNLNGFFPNGIFQIQTLEVLDVSDNHDLHGCFPDILQDVSLKALNLSKTNFSGQLPDSISNMKQLSALDLSSCQFNGTLPVSMSSTLTQLVHLDLSFNEFTGPVPPLNVSKNLRYLCLWHNNLTGSIQSSHLEGLVNLITINLGENSLSGKVPPSLFALPNLQELTLSHNGFDGPLDEFPNASSSQLQLVDLGDNKLQGIIPVSLFQLTRLSFLQLSNNKFNGTIQLEYVIRNLRNLHILGLSNNMLSVNTASNDDHGLSSFPMLKYLFLVSCKLKEFPVFLRNQPLLNALDLSNNQIQGIIPNWVWRFDSLVYLNLSNNLLTGLEGPLEDIDSNIYILDLHSNQLPGSIPMFTKYAVHLDYSSNRFTFVPPNMDKKIPYLINLSISHNSLHGKVDELFCNFSTLLLLDLSHNTFHGSIPKCLTRRNSTLRVVNLADNQLTGHIPDTIPSSCNNLRYLDLNQNFLNGPIPKSLANCRMLQVLNLGKNLLSGGFPCFLSNISTLRVLSLRSNKLHGPMECGKRSSGNDNNWKMLHIVDLASNNFSGLVPGSLLKMWTKMVGDENQTHEKYGALSSDIYENPNAIHWKDLLTIIDEGLAMKLYKMLAGEPYSVVDRILGYYAGSNSLGGRYLDSVTVVDKGLQMKLVKIPTIFTSLDLSCNNLEGPIPEELMRFRALNVLNLSHNFFSSQIPKTLGSLIYLESLDLSSNNLSGVIPEEITGLSFLSVLNLSFNHLVGKIPTGTQIQSFEAGSFQGNDGLCGPPLTKDCGGDNGDQGLSISRSWPSSATHGGSISWRFLSAELGFTFGIGMVIIPLILWKRWRMWYSKKVDNLLHEIFPQLEFAYEHRGSLRYRSLRWRRPR